MKETLRKIIVAVLMWEAKEVLKKYKPRIMLVTGSVGKTSTKDAVFTALSGSFFVRKSEKSFNSDIGVPLTVLGVPNGWSNPFIWLKNIVEGATLLLLSAPYPKWLVLEVGADRPGDITRSLAWLSPHMVVATRFPDVSVHVEFYGSAEQVIEEELAPANWLKTGGVLVVNADDTHAGAVVPPSGVQKVSYGFSGDATVRAMRFHASSKNKMPAGVSFDTVYGKERAHISIPGVLGVPHATSVIAGIAAAVSVGVSLEDAAARFSKHVTPPGRMRLIQGARGTVLIDDTYNASPVATEEALHALKNVPHYGKRIAVLADMLELGSYSVQEHDRIGKLAAVSSDTLVAVGIRARGLAKAALEAGMPSERVFTCESNIDAVPVLESLIGEGDVVLIKGSQSMRMEHVVKALMANPGKAEELLVRQDVEWHVR